MPVLRKLRPRGQHSGRTPNVQRPQRAEHSTGGNEPESHHLDKSRPRQVKVTRVSGASPVSPGSTTFSIADNCCWQGTEVDYKQQNRVSRNQEQDHQQADVREHGIRWSKHARGFHQPFALRHAYFGPHVVQRTQACAIARPAGVARPHDDADSRQNGECHLQSLPSYEQGAPLLNVRRRSLLHAEEGTH